MFSEHKRVKHGQQPGDITRDAKIAMRERRHLAIYSRDENVGGFWYFPWQFISDKAAHAFRRELSERSRTVQRRRDRTAIHEGLEE